MRKQGNNTLRLSKNNKGVTLVEMIAVIAVLGVVIAAVTGFMITGTQMSATVSGTASESLKTQAAVDFINRQLWEVEPQNLSVWGDTEIIESKEYFSLIIDGAELSTCHDENGAPYVGYRFGDESAEPIYLCPGEISFKITGNTVEYNINGIKHVVHVRVAETEAENAAPEV